MIREHGGQGLLQQTREQARQDRLMEFVAVVPDEHS
jgi:hypothetical protein